MHRLGGDSDGLESITFLFRGQTSQTFPKYPVVFLVTVPLVMRLPTCTIVNRATPEVYLYFA